MDEKLKKYIREKAEKLAGTMTVEVAAFSAGRTWNREDMEGFFEEWLTKFVEEQLELEITE